MGWVERVLFGPRRELMPRLVARSLPRASLAQALGRGTVHGYVTAHRPRTAIARRVSAKQLSTGALSTAQSSQQALLSSLRGTTLGDDTLEATKTSQWQAQMLAESRNQSSWMERWVKRDELQRWIQIAATLAIPLSAAIWRAIFRSARGD